MTLAHQIIAQLADGDWHRTDDVLARVVTPCASDACRAWCAESRRVVLARLQRAGLVRRVWHRMRLTTRGQAWALGGWSEPGSGRVDPHDVLPLLPATIPTIARSGALTDKRARYALLKLETLGIARRSPVVPAGGGSADLWEAA